MSTHIASFFKPITSIVSKNELLSDIPTIKKLYRAIIESDTPKNGFVRLEGEDIYRRVNVFGGVHRIRVNADESWSIMADDPVKNKVLHASLINFAKGTIFSASGSPTSNMQPHDMGTHLECVEFAFVMKVIYCLEKMKDTNFPVTFERVQAAFKQMQNGNGLKFWGVIETPTDDSTLEYVDPQTQQTVIEVVEANYEVVWKSMIQKIQEKYDSLDKSDGKAIKLLSGAVPWAEFGKKWEQTSLCHVIIQLTKIWEQCPEIFDFYKQSDFKFLEVTPFETGTWGRFGDLNADVDVITLQHRLNIIMANENSHAMTVTKWMCEENKYHRLLLSAPGATKNTLASYVIGRLFKRFESFSEIRKKIQETLDQHDKTPFPDFTVEEVDQMVKPDTADLRKEVRKEAKLAKDAEDAVDNYKKAMNKNENPEETQKRLEQRDTITTAWKAAFRQLQTSMKVIQFDFDQALPAESAGSKRSASSMH